MTTPRKLSDDTKSVYHCKCTILAIDAWGNADDGYQYNDWRPIGTIDVDPDNHAEVLGKLVTEGYITHAADLVCEDVGIGLEIQLPDGCPILQLEYPDE